jgi:hypothetical protein
MSAGKIALAVVLSLIVVVGISIAWVVGIKFEAGRFENQITASNQNLQNVHSSVNKILKSSGITVKNFGETKIKAIEAAVQRYADKPQLMMQWVQENPQQIDSKIWEKFQDQIEVQYTKFEMEQKDKISKSQAYKDFLDNSVRGQVAQMVWSYPKPETQKIMDQVIMTGETKGTFETGIDESVDPFETAQPDTKEKETK